VKTIRDIANKRAVKGDIAVEIEVEGSNLPQESLELSKAGWTTHAEGSLRGNSLEYVMTSPRSIQGVEESLFGLERIFKDNKTRLADTYRAGIHVHLNVQEMTAKQVITLVTAYYVLEELLINWCDKSRIGNHFCLRGKDAEFVIQTLIDCVEENTLSPLNTDQIRYASINLSSLFKFGSLEFRALESTKNYKKVMLWCRIINALKVNSLKYSSPADLLTRISRESSPVFMENMLGEYASLFMVGDWRKSVREGIHLVQDVAFGRDWSEEINFNIFKDTQGVFG
jgi:hypothetical protein